MSYTYTLKLESIGDDVALVFPDDFVAKHKLAEGDCLILDDDKVPPTLTLVNPRFRDQML
jgi:hypothetical protein